MEFVGARAESSDGRSLLPLYLILRSDDGSIGLNLLKEHGSRVTRVGA